MEDHQDRNWLESICCFGGWGGWGEQLDRTSDEHRPNHTIEENGCPLIMLPDPCVLMTLLICVNIDITWFVQEDDYDTIMFWDKLYIILYLCMFYQCSPSQFILKDMIHCSVPGIAALRWKCKRRWMTITWSSEKWLNDDANSRPKSIKILQTVSNSDPPKR